LKILQLKDHLNYGETGAAARTDTWQRRALCTRMACAAELGLGERPTTGRRRRVSGWAWAAMARNKNNDRE